jgi:hypothetical protein
VRLLPDFRCDCRWWTCKIQCGDGSSITGSWAGERDSSLCLCLWMCRCCEGAVLIVVHMIGLVVIVITVHIAIQEAHPQCTSTRLTLRIIKILIVPD